MRKKTDARWGTTPLVLATLSACVAGNTARAQQPPQEPRGDLINYAYAALFGSGFYAVADSTVQVYRIPITVPLRSAEEKSWGLKLRLPVTLGFFDFKVRDVPVSGLPDNAETFSFVPGVEFPLPLRDKWVLEPFLNFGAGKDFSGGGVALIYSVGARSRFTFPWKAAEFTLGNTLLYVGHNIVGDPLAGDRSDAVVLFETGLDARLPLGFHIGRRKADFSVYVISYLYLNHLEFLRVDDDPLRLDKEYEVGVTFGSDKPLSWWKIRVPRFGVSYRFGNDLSAVRLTFGNAF